MSPVPDPARKAVEPKRTVKKKTAIAAKSFSILHALKSEVMNTYIKVRKTDSAYEGHLARGMRFLEDLIAERQTNGIAICDEGIATDGLASAFDTSGPNKYSAVALEYYIIQKCFNEKLKKSTAMGIHAAFCRYWDTM